MEDACDRGSPSACELFARNVPGLTERLSKAVVGIAGCGGLGSNAAVSLVRAGVGKLILADFDRVELTNLNRQHFFLEDVGRLKVHALADQLWRIHPEVELEVHPLELTSASVRAVFGKADLLIEAFDRAESKRWLIESWCLAFPERTVVCGSGLAGYGRSESLSVRRAGSIVIVGDEESDMAMGLCSARVAIVAHMQANAAIEELMAERPGRHDSS